MKFWGHAEEGFGTRLFVISPLQRNGSARGMPLRSFVSTRSACRA